MSDIEKFEKWFSERYPEYEVLLGKNADGTCKHDMVRGMLVAFVGGLKA